MAEVFNTAQEAYTHLFLKLQEQGVDIETASDRAYKFSSQYAERMALPNKIEPKEKGIKGLLNDFKTISEFLKENPTIAEVGLPIVKGTGAAILGALLGTKAADTINNSSEAIQPIEYEDIQQENIEQ